MFLTELDKHAAWVADEIVNEFQRLGVSVDDDPMSGLMTASCNLNTDKAVIKIFDDHANGFYDGDLVLAHLITLENADLESIWQEIAAFEV